MFVVVQRPLLHHRQRALQILEQKSPHGKLGRAKGGEVLERRHRALEIIQAVAGHIVPEEQADKTTVQARGQGIQKLEGLCIVQGDHRVQAFTDAGHALHHRQPGKVLAGVLEKPPGIERRVHRAHLIGDVLQALEVEDFLEGRGALVGHGESAGEGGHKTFAR